MVDFTQIYLEMTVVSVIISGIAVCLVVKRLKGDYDIGYRFAKN